MMPEAFGFQTSEKTFSYGGSRMKTLNGKKVLILLIHAFVLWGICGAVMGIGMAVFGLQTALIIHAIAAPLISIVVSSLYFLKFNYTSPLATASVFLTVVVFMDLFLVALIISGSLDMFKSFVGTWLPFTLIFFASYLTGILWKKRGKKIYSDKDT
jgi:uncharacterized membrane protein YjgN (DUF898 family)